MGFSSTIFVDNLCFLGEPGTPGERQTLVQKAPGGAVIEVLTRLTMAFSATLSAFTWARHYGRETNTREKAPGGAIVEVLTRLAMVVATITFVDNRGFLGEPGTPGEGYTTVKKFTAAVEVLTRLSMAFLVKHVGDNPRYYVSQVLLSKENPRREQSTGRHCC